MSFVEKGDSMVSLYFEATEEQEEELEKIKLTGYPDILSRLYDEVYCYEEFGSYQGDWLAKVRKGDKVFWLKGCFGSCSGCDWFLGKEDYPWTLKCKNFEEAKKQYQEETDRILKDFEDDYGSDTYTQEELEKYYDDLDKEYFDTDDAYMITFVKMNRDIEKKGDKNGKAN